MIQIPIPHHKRTPSFELKDEKTHEENHYINKQELLIIQLHYTIEACS